MTQVVTELIGSLLESRKQLPLNVYQIERKFRDEARPRAGLIRYVTIDGCSR